MKYLLTLIGGLVLSLLFVIPAFAKQNHDSPKGNAFGLTKQEQNADRGNGNRGAVWTTDSTQSQQDENHYEVGESVYLAGQNLPTGTLSYTIYTNPPSAKKGTVVTTGTVTVDENGDLDPTLIWTIPQSSGGVYKVVLSTGSHKSDNFKVISKAAPPEPEPEPEPPATPPQGGGQVVAQAKVLGAKTLPTAGPNLSLTLFLTIGLWLVSIRFFGRKI